MTSPSSPTPCEKQELCDALRRLEAALWSYGDAERRIFERGMAHFHTGRWWWWRRRWVPWVRLRWQHYRFVRRYPELQRPPVDVLLVIQLREDYANVKDMAARMFARRRDGDATGRP